MDINIFIWVTDVLENEGGSILDGIAFDGDLGFGNEDIRNFSGNLAAYSQNGRFVIESNLSVMHIANKGMVWSLSSKQLPRPPFLLSSKLNLIGPVEKTINAELTLDAEKALDDGGYGQYPIIAKDVIGLFKYQENNYSIIIFSDLERSLEQISWEPVFSEWDLKVGKLFDIN